MKSCLFRLIKPIEFRDVKGHNLAYLRLDAKVTIYKSIIIRPILAYTAEIRPNTAKTARNS